VFIRDSNKKLGCTARIRGAGWLSSDHGKDLLDAYILRQAALTTPNTAHQLGGHHGIGLENWAEAFEYEHKDKHEWTVTVQTDFGIFKNTEDTVVNTMKLIPPKSAGAGLQVGECTVA
jgi:hypothetical protein